MRIKLPVNFEAAPGWEAWCQYAMRAFDAATPKQKSAATLIYDPTQRLIIFDAKLPDIIPVYMQLDMLAVLTPPEAFMAAWTICLGQNMLLTPHVESSKLRSGETFYLLRALFDAESAQTGLFTSCAKLVRHAEKVPADGVRYIHALAETLKE